MDKHEVGAILKRINEINPNHYQSSSDQHRLGMVDAWHELIGDLDYMDAYMAVMDFYTKTREAYPVTPGEIIARSEQVRRDRQDEARRRLVRKLRNAGHGALSEAIYETQHGPFNPEWLND